MTRMWITPITLRAAADFVARFHRHNKPPVGHKFSVGLVWVDPVLGIEDLIGVGIAGRPVARHLDDGKTLEVTRLCVVDYAPKWACSMIYRALWRSWKEMGGKKMVTYTLQSESGASLRGAGWVREAELDGSNGSAWTNRAGREDQAVTRQAKVRWSVQA